MLFIKELKKICFSFIYVLFIGLLLFSWHENFYGVTTKEITGSQGNEVSISSGLTGGSILEKPEKNKESSSVVILMLLHLIFDAIPITLKK